MGRKKGKTRQSRQSQYLASPASPPGFEGLGSPNLVELKDINVGAEVVIPSSKEPLGDIYKTVYLSGDDLNLMGTSEKKLGSRGSNSSSYHDLIDGGAYNQFRNSRQSLNRSKMDFESAGDRVMAGSRSISHRSLFNDDRSFGAGGNQPKTSLGGSRVSIEWDNMVEEPVRISRRDNGSKSNLEVIGTSASYDDAARKPFTRSRTVSSGGSNRVSLSQNNNLLQPFSASQQAIDHTQSDDVRTYHAGSEYLQNRLSKLSIHSNNDEFVLVGGHPPPVHSSSSIDSLSRDVPIPRPRSRMSSYSENKKTPSIRSISQEDLLGRSVSQQSLTGNEQNGHFSRSSSRFTVGTSSNTDDRLILAARYSQSPEAEGLISLNQSFHPSRHSSRNSVDRVGFVEIPTLYSHPDEKFDDNEPGEPFRPVSEHSATPTSTSRTRPSLVREDAVDGGLSSSSSSLSRREPPRALLVTSALTPVVPKRHAPMSLSHSEESLVMKTPQTVQRASDHQKLRQMETIKKTVETAVQTGNSIRLRQNQHFGDVLSECAYLPEPTMIGMSPAKTASYVPESTASEVEIPKNSIRARLRHISDLYSTDGNDEPQKRAEIPKIQKNIHVEIPKKTVEIPKSLQFVTIPKNQNYPISQKFVDIPKNQSYPISQKTVEIPKYKKSTEEIIVPISKPFSSTIEIPKEAEKSGDTIRKHIPRGRIRDLASAFDKMTEGSPARLLEFKSQVHIPAAAREENNHFWIDSSNMKKTNGGIGAESNNDVRLSSRSPSIPLSGPLSGPLNGSSSSAFRSSTQTIRSQEERRRSTSSSLHQQPHVFTRNTFLTSSIIKPGDKSNLPSNVAMTTNYRMQDVPKDGFVSAFEKIPHHTSSTHLNDDIENRRLSSHYSANSNRNSPTKEATFSEYSRKVDVPVRLEVPITGKPSARNKRMAAHPRAKTQEIPSGTYEFESRYESRALSGDLNESNVFGMQKPLFAASREAFGRDTAEDLRGKQENWPSMRPQHQWTSEFHMSESKNTNSVSSPIYHHEIHIPSNQPSVSRKSSIPLATSASTIVRQPVSTMARHPYSPPATEDAGSRITHHTSQTLQSEDQFAATEDSSIRGKIDRMFDFVESDDSRKTMLRPLPQNIESNASTETIGTNGINNQSNQNNNSNTQQQQHKYREKFAARQNWVDAARLGGGVSKAAEIPQALKQRQEPKMKSPERRNTVTVPEMEYFDTELEYSLSQYREMQREQLRRRLPSADEPQFFRSPTLTAPHAGQSLHAYRSKDLMGTPTAGEKLQFRFPSSSSNLRLPPAALATSTPVDSPSGRQSSFSINKNYSQLEMMNSHTIPPNETFVSSISGVSAADKHADVMKRINRLTYMIENTQKQMSMNEAALLDAVKKGRRSQEIAAHRSILISRETLRLQRNELRRLHAFSAVRRPPPPVAKELRGSVIFNNLIVHLNKLFISRLGVKEDNSYSFVALFKFGHQVEATELVPLRVFAGEETCDKLFFVKQIQFSDVPVDFMVSIEIYAMRIPAAKPAELSIGTSLANKCKSLMGPPQKKSSVPLETAFKFRGRLVLDRDAQGERCLYLDDVTYPLEGTVMITTQCSRLPEAFEIDFRGFLTMFHTISNMASWERYWAVLRRGVVLFWKYPDDEQMGREPKMQIDLTKCTNNSIEKCGFDLCPRANSFVVEILVDSDDGTIGSVVEKKRVLLSADTTEMLSQWLFTLNQTLDVIRGPI